jgi:acyl homoserine lactone synthase
LEQEIGMEITAGFSKRCSRGLVTDLAVYRHKVFVETLGWQLKCENALEFDQFDHDDTLYVAAKNEEGRINGCARLLPTTGPYLLGDVFPQLLNGLAPPSSADVWELSRFAAMDFASHAAGGAGQFSSPVAVGLLRASIETAARHGAKRLITVSPLGIERLLRKAGFQAWRAGPPVIVDGHPLFACWIPCDDTIREKPLSSRASSVVQDRQLMRHADAGMRA